MEIVKALNLGIRFILELTLLIVLAYSGYQIFENAFARWAFALGLPMVAAGFWGYFIAPKAAHVLSMPWRSLVVFGLFSIACLLLVKAGQARLAIVFMSTYIVNEILMLAWKQ